MRVLHVTAHKHDAYNSFQEAAKFSTGNVRHSTECIKWEEGDSIHFRSIRTLEDAHRLAGYYFDLIIFDTTLVEEEIKAYLLSLVRSP